MIEENIGTMEDLHDELVKSEVWRKSQQAIHATVNEVWKSLSRWYVEQGFSESEAHVWVEDDVDELLEEIR